jgi:hypothetical protein
MRIFIFISFLMFTSQVAWAVSVPQHVSPIAVEEFTAVEAIKFRDTQSTANSTSIPKSWKLISVSTGEKSNSSNLWFQDSDGSVFLLQGFTAQNKFFIHENVYKIPVK